MTSKQLSKHEKLKVINRGLQKILVLLFVVMGLILPKKSFSQLVIDSILTTASTCPNNGSMEVYAKTVAPPLLYSITAGPVTAPLQTNAIFNSLPAGTYTVSVTDAAANTLTQEVVISGNYVQPDFAPIKIPPSCPGGNDGQLIGNVIAGTGNGPFTWQLIAPSPVTTAPQNIDTFSNLPAGNYTMRLTDGCSGFRTMVVTLSDPPAANLGFVTQPRINIAGCDSAMITMPLFSTTYHFPLTCTFETTAGTVTTTTPTIIDTTGSCCGYFTVEQLLPNFTYGDFIKISITDACGNNIVSNIYHAKPFVFCPSLKPYFDNCNYKDSVDFTLNNAGCDIPDYLSTAIKGPATYEAIDQLTNLVTEAGTAVGIRDNNGYSLLGGVTFHSLQPNRNYTITIKDSCGKTFTQSYFMPAVVTPTPFISSKTIYKDGCHDSTAFAFIFAEQFKTVARLILLSGPTVMGSTKPGYAYSGAYVYPDTLVHSGHGDNVYRFDISNLSAGTYQFKVIDSCGTELFDELTIAPEEVTSFGHKFWYTKGCLGQNSLHYAINAANGFMNVYNLTTGFYTYKYYQSQNFAAPIEDEITNLPSGTYAVTFTYQNYFGAGTQANSGTIDCQVITETITIEGYKTPTIATSNYIKCKAAVYAVLLPDSTKGVPPYQYEIVSGPQTFAPQASNFFSITEPGTYTARIYDVCGNASTAQVTVDTLSFAPIKTIHPDCSSTKLFYGSSPYNTYHWLRPDNSMYIGDTLAISPVTPADTGLYHVQKIVNINGCIDTFYTTYQLDLKNTNRLSNAICIGGSVQVGTHTYTAAGIYTDTLIGSKGCDSIVVLSLTVNAFKRDSINNAVCPGQSFLFNGHAYTQAGIYRDTLSTATCDSIITLNLSIAPYKKDSITRVACPGQSFSFNGHAYTQAGIYRDTLSTATCDSIITLNLSIAPYKKDSITRSACPGEPFLFNGHAYTQAGIYRDTLSTATCDSIITLNLGIAPFKKDSISRSACMGQGFLFNGHTYTQPGIYRDTLSTATCDSIAILNLSLLPAAPIQITASQYTVDEGGTVQLSVTPSLSYLWSAANALISNPVIQNPSAIIHSSAWIYVTANSNTTACVASDSVFITMNTTPCSGEYIYMPSAFSPNNDGLNDVFKVMAQKVALTKFCVFNRWGQKVFETSDAKQGWNGIYKGEMIAGNYVYMITYIGCDNTVKSIKGSVLLIR